MKSIFLSTARLAVTAIFTFPTIAMAWGPGIYPATPLRMTTSGFSVDNQDRNDVVAFWHAVYQASESLMRTLEREFTAASEGTPHIVRK